jgi:hypothetical protein
MQLFIFETMRGKAARKINTIAAEFSAFSTYERAISAERIWTTAARIGGSALAGCKQTT